MRITKIAASMMTLGMAVSPFAYATNGMNLSGYGPEAHAMGGASMAYDNGTAATMNNPATLGLMKEGSRVDVALGGLFPDVTAKAGAASVKSDSTAFYMPAVGYATKVGQLTYGVGMFSQGGMGTEYAAGSLMSAGSSLKTRSEVGVGRLIFPLAYQMDDKITLGGSVDYVWAGMDVLMAMSGASMMDMFPTAVNPLATQAAGTLGGSMITTALPAMMPMMNPANPINWGYFSFSDNGSFSGLARGNGFAGKIGMTYRVSSQLTVGATYHSKTAISDLDTQVASVTFNANVDTGILGGGAPSGTYAAVPITVPGKVSVKNFQWPATYGIGVAFQATDELMVVADFKRIGWKDVMKDFKLSFTADSGLAGMIAGLSNTVMDATLYQNWEDQNVYQVGAAYKVNPELTVRAGVNIANNPVPNAYMNPLFPAIAKTNLSAGFGYKVSQQSSIDASFATVPKTSATNAAGVSVDFGGYSAQFLYSYLY